MRIEIDEDRCQGNTMCVVAAPELIQINPDTERAVLRRGAVVPTEHEDDALMAADGCPETAIRVIED